MSGIVGARRKLRKRADGGFRYCRDVFFANYGIGPWVCFICGKLVYYGWQEIHHKDGDRTNNDPENLAPTHKACHNRHHFSGKNRPDWLTRKLKRMWRSKSRRQNLSKKLKAAWADPKKRARILAGRKREES